MVLKEEIISKHIIKPSSPTPDKFKICKLSFLDQIAAVCYIPLIFFYKNDESKAKPRAETSELLKQSLSQILTVYHPFAGVIRENSYVECNDTGVEFVEARVHAPLAQVTEERHMEELRQLTPVDSICHDDNLILLVKVNFFDCGGIALGVCLSHKVADFASVSLFMNAWAAACRGDSDHIIQPSFNLLAHFPPRELAPLCFDLTKEEIKIKRLVFEREKLGRIKQQVASSSDVKNTTTVEALTIFIWQQFIEAHKAISGTEKTSFAAFHAANLRPRTTPPIPDHTIGNCMSACYAFASDTTECREMLTNLRAAIREVDDNYIRKVVNSEEYVRKFSRMGELVMSGTELLTFSSWWRFPVYTVDFGWGKPVWVSTANLPIQNLVILMSTPSGDGIEAWINMPEDLFHMLQTNYVKLLN